MKISNYLKRSSVFLDVHFSDKSDILNFIADTCKKEGLVTNTSGLLDGLEKREQTMSTGIGNGIGLPHTAFEEVAEPRILIIRPTSPVDFEALDHEPVTIIIALILPENQTTLHIQMLAAVSRLCKNEQFMKCIRMEMDIDKLLIDIKDIEAKMAFH